MRVWYIVVQCDINGIEIQHIRMVSKGMRVGVVFVAAWYCMGVVYCIMV